MTGIGLGVAFFTGIGLGLAGVLLVLAGAVFLWAGGQSRFAVVGLAFALSLVGAWRSPEPTNLRSDRITEGHASLTGKVDSFPVTTSVGQRFDIWVENETGDTPYRFCVNSESQQAVDKGSIVRFEGTVTSIDDLALGLQSALRSRACDASIETSKIVVFSGPPRFQTGINAVRDRISHVFQRAAPGDTGALMTGLVTGDDSALSFDARAAFLDTGTTHITAVSGSNFAVIALIAAAASGGTGTRRRVSWIAVTASAIWFYAILVGLPPSALRAALMATFALFAVRLGRRPDFVSLLVVCGAVQVALRPSDLHSLSFQLSMVATLALVLVFSGQELGLRRAPTAIVATAIAAHMATVPVLAYRLTEIAPATVPTNILISPLTLIGFSFAAFASVVGLFSETIGVAAATPAAFVSQAIVAIVTYSSELLPGRTSTGAASGGSLLALSFVCWSVVLVMSSDVRTAMARAWDWLIVNGGFARVAIVSAPVIAVVVYAVGTLAR